MCSVNFSFTFDIPVRHVQFRCDGCQEVEVISETGQTHVNLHSVQLGDEKRWGFSPKKLSEWILIRCCLGWTQYPEWPDNDM